MSEVKSLNLSGGYDPMRSVDRESYADKVRKTSQMVLSQAMGQYQMKQAQQNIENQQTMRRADEYFGENMNEFMSSSANIKDPKSWSFNTGETREKAFNDYRDKVGGNYSAFNQAWAQKQQAESQALFRSLGEWRKEVGNDDEFGKIYSEWYDNLPEVTKNNLMSNASQDLYTSLNSLYIPEKDRKGLLEKFVTPAVSLGGLALSYKAPAIYRGLKAKFSSEKAPEEIVKEANKKKKGKSRKTTSKTTGVKGKIKDFYKNVNIREISNRSSKVGGTEEKNFINKVKKNFSKAATGKNSKNFMNRLIKITNNPTVKKKLTKVVAKGVAKSSASGATGVGAPLSIIFGLLTVKEIYDLYNDPEIQSMLDG
tara:strand:- start:3055 stop:4158 length:1104 start_codon:yes stop_codon:yes gene_type:complete